MDISKQIEIFEKILGVHLVYHDVRYQFFSRNRIKCRRQYINLHYRHGEYCPIGEVASCVKHCVVKLRNTLIAERPVCRLWHCRKGYVQAVAPVFRNDILCGVLFAGLWQRPLDRVKIRQTAAVLPVIAAGLTEQMENFLTGQSKDNSFEKTVSDFLEQHYNEKITLHDLARKLALSPSRICHLVTEHFGKPFTALLMDFRLEKACRFLTGQYLSVNEIAGLCAFSSVNYFSASFRKKFGISPKIYQQKYSRRKISCK